MGVDVCEDRVMSTPVRVPARDVATCCPPLGVAALDQDAAEQLSGALKAIADPARLRIVSMIAAADAGEVCACDLPERLGLSQPTVSHHCRVLVDAGILSREKRGTWAWYALVPGALDAVASVLTGRPAGGSALR
jgi:ArsR family transcriptional regulator